MRCKSCGRNFKAIDGRRKFCKRTCAEEYHAEAKRKHPYDPTQNNKRIKRRCLSIKCGNKIFWAVGKFNRLCCYCKNLAKDLEESYSDRITISSKKSRST